MKRFACLFIVFLAFASCQDDVKFNTPGFQGLKDDVFWRATNSIAYVSPDGAMSIEGLTQFEELVLETSGSVPGTYILGTSNLANAAYYSSVVNQVELEYETIAVPGAAALINLVAAGTGYSSGTAVATTGGTGSGLSVNVVANGLGVVTTITLSSRGNGYLAGDIVTVSGGNLNCRFTVVNVQNSNGEIEITEYDNVNMTVSGKFKFNAANVNDSPFGGPILNFQYGEFYKIPVVPAL